jgi:hypothetical protein
MLCLVVDNFSGHKHPRSLARPPPAMSGVFLLTYSCWLNWIPEPELAALRRCALNGADHRTHAEQGEAIVSYIR